MVVVVVVGIAETFVAGVIACNSGEGGTNIVTEDTSRWCRLKDVILGSPVAASGRFA